MGGRGLVYGWRGRVWFGTTASVAPTLPATLLVMTINSSTLSSNHLLSTDNHNNHSLFAIITLIPLFAEEGDKEESFE